MIEGRDAEEELEQRHLDQMTEQDPEHLDDIKGIAAVMYAAGLDTVGEPHYHRFLEKSNELNLQSWSTLGVFI